MARVAIDVMGGDHAPEAVLAGARAARDAGGVDLVLVGPEPVVAGSGFEYVAASQVVAMDDKPSRAARDKADSSMKVALELVRDGKVDAAMSAGNTGAWMATALFTLGRIPGIDRPAFGGIFPTRHGRGLVIDLGANADAKPAYLRQFAVMGSVYMRTVWGVDRPKVGLLNIGEEEGKGNALTQEAYRLLKQAPIDFAGNVEGKDLPEGTVDVVVCDGFTGNVVVKLSEGMASVLSGWIREEIGKEKLGLLGALLLRPAFARVRKRLDYAEYGAAPLFGVDGLAVVAHGRSNARAIQRAIDITALAVRQDFIASLRQALVPATEA
ncbi:MAG: phosphate acyltransferase PlsX [Chloroflexota bacterium]